MYQSETEMMVQGIDVEKVRNDFPLLTRTVYGKPLVYFDNAATSQKPTAVLDALEDYYRLYNSNVHRGVHSLSQEATEAYEVPGKKWLLSSMPKKQKKLYLRAVPRRASIWWLPVLPKNF